MYAVNDEQLKKLMDIVMTFSDDINMEFGLDKCARATFIKIIALGLTGVT